MSLSFEDAQTVGEAAAVENAAPRATATMPELPSYMKEIYDWAYVNPTLVALLDRQIVVQTILWGNANRLVKAAVEEFEPGDDVLQTANVYGYLPATLARKVGPTGRYEVRDVTPIQVKRVRKKLEGMDHATVIHANAIEPYGRIVDKVCCFFLLHEVPDDYKYRIVNNVLEATRVGGKAVFVDYHQWNRFHPMGPIMWAVFRYLEPFAASLCASKIQDYSELSSKFTWTKKTFFGGLYQKVVATRVEE
ncbi:rhodoquinone biosynthesis methyltransferase RquA [Breoghania sp.]|uniref:rhodoquinone biosynthesis methyltransferase RquA n=1 Tax=Breoghania sp. TaxID=2065378 RepID=UPI002AA85E82|nr:rhodoquinone biosynthesis methyltransferase RquA [Breoghania sp.]